MASSWRIFSPRLDIADYVELFAPPYLIASTIHDMFPLEGARQSYQEARGFYRLFQAEDRVGLVDRPGVRPRPDKRTRRTRGFGG
jgi:hypothetical protein